MPATVKYNARRENAGGSRLRRRAASRRFYADLRAHPAAERRASRKRPRQAAPARDKIRVGFQLTPARGRNNHIDDSTFCWYNLVLLLHRNENNAYVLKTHRLAHFVLSPAQGLRHLIGAQSNLTAVQYNLIRIVEKED